MVTDRATNVAAGMLMLACAFSMLQASYAAQHLSPKLNSGDDCWRDGAPQHSLCPTGHECHRLDWSFSALGCRNYHCCTDVSSLNIGDGCFLDGQPRHDLCPGDAKCFRQGSVPLNNPLHGSYGGELGCSGYHCCSAPVVGQLKTGDDCWRTFLDSDGIPESQGPAHWLCPAGHECLRSYHPWNAGVGNLGCRNIHCCTDVRLKLGDGCFDAERNQGRDDLCPGNSACRRRDWDPLAHGGCDGYHCCVEVDDK